MQASSIINSLLQINMKPLSVKQLVEEYLHHMEYIERNSLHSVINYKHWLGRFLEFVGDINLHEIELSTINKFREHLSTIKGKGKLLSPMTQKYHLHALRSFIIYCEKRQYMCLPHKLIDLPKQKDIEQPIPASFTPDEIKRLFNLFPKDSWSIKVLRDQLIIEILYSSGMRISEIHALNRDSIDLTTGSAIIRGKGRVIRTVYFTDYCINTLRKYLEIRQYDKEQSALFVNFVNNGRLSMVAIERLVQMYIKKAGIFSTPDRHLTVHSFRHSFATHLLMNGAQMREVQTMLGHQSITTTQRYTNLANPYLKEIHKRFHTVIR